MYHSRFFTALAALGPGSGLTARHGRVQKVLNVGSALSSFMICYILELDEQIDRHLSEHRGANSHLNLRNSELANETENEKIEIATEREDIENDNREKSW